MAPAAMQKEWLVHDRQTLFVKELGTGVPGSNSEVGRPMHHLYLKCSIIIFFLPFFCRHSIHRPVNQLFQLRVVCLAAASAFSARASSCPGPEGAEELA